MNVVKHLLQDSTYSFFCLYYQSYVEILHNSHASPNIIGVMESKRMEWVGLVERLEEMRNAHSILAGKPEGRDHSEDLGIDKKIILKWILGK